MAATPEVVFESRLAGTQSADLPVLDPPFAGAASRRAGVSGRRHRAASAAPPAIRAAGQSGCNRQAGILLPSEITCPCAEARARPARRVWSPRQLFARRRSLSLPAARAKRSERPFAASRPSQSGEAIMPSATSTELTGLMLAVPEGGGEACDSGEAGAGSGGGSSSSGCRHCDGRLVDAGAGSRSCCPSSPSSAKRRRVNSVVDDDGGGAGRLLGSTAGSEKRAGRALAAASDLRCHQPRLLPRLSPWDRRNAPAALLRPGPQPGWVTRLQARLPWAKVTARAGGGPWLSPPGAEMGYSPLRREVASRWRNVGDREWMLVRISLYLAMIVGLVIMNLVLAEPLTAAENVTIIWDRFHEWFRGLNKLLIENQVFFSWFMLIGATLMDVLVLLAFGHWALLGDSFRLPIAYGLLYGVRAFMRYVNILPFPDRYVWGFPTFGSFQWRSLTVPMVPADDFFYSGHIGCGTLSTIEHLHNGFHIGVYYNAVTIIYTCVLMWGTRGHYTIDLLSGAVFAWWVWCLGRYFGRYIDQWLALPPRPLLDTVKFHNQLAACNSAAATAGCACDACCGCCRCRHACSGGKFAYSTSHVGSECGPAAAVAQGHHRPPPGGDVNYPPFAPTVEIDSAPSIESLPTAVPPSPIAQPVAPRDLTWPQSRAASYAAQS